MTGRSPWRLPPFWKELLESALFAVVVTQFGATLVTVNGASMMPNLRHGERLLLPKYETWLHKAGVGEFRRGDILVFKPPAEAGQLPGPLGLWSYRPFLVKRLVGLPGDTVRIEAGRVSVNGREVAQAFTTDYWRREGCWDTESSVANHALSNDDGLVATQKTFTVPAGQYFVMGDNRTERGSRDSRLFGSVPRRDVAGRAAAVVWPPLRRQDAAYDCRALPSPERHVRYTGRTEPNLRLLTRPAAFQAAPLP